MKKQWFRLLTKFCVLAFVIAAMPITTSATELSSVLNDKNISTTVQENSYAIESPILGENTALREKNIKYFRCEDGSLLAAIYENPVHYEEDGQWKDIDNKMITRAV